MPLVMLFGQPQTGKQGLADELLELCRQKGVEAVEVSPRSLGFAQEDLIRRQSELNKRIYQTTQQFLTAKVLVVVNHTNHLKSFRYELFCLARERKTPCCVLSTYNAMASNDTAAMPQDLYEDICSRFEQLLDQEWDQPVFQAAAAALDYSLSGAKKTVKKATLMNRTKEIPLFELLNGATQRLAQKQQALGPACCVQVHGDVYFTAKRLFTVPELQKAARDFKERCEAQGNAAQAELFRVFLEQLQ